MIDFPALAFGADALSPLISEQTVSLHYSVIHKTYVARLRELLSTSRTHDAHSSPSFRPGAETVALGSSERREPNLESLVRSSNGAVAGLAAEVHDHDLYWKSLSPHPILPDRLLAAMIERDFGSFHNFKAQVLEASQRMIVCGWIWLVLDADGYLLLLDSTDVRHPLQLDLHPLLAVDVHEHAYLLDQGAERQRYVRLFVDHLINWNTARDRLLPFIEQSSALRVLPYHRR